MVCPKNMTKRLGLTCSKGILTPHTYLEARVELQFAGLVFYGIERNFSQYRLSLPSLGFL
jgi:hypothetical protein